MDFNWGKRPAQPDCSLKQREIEESFEDPFSVRLLPDSPFFASNARFFNLGRTSGGEGVFAIYRANGKQIQVICARAFTAEEGFFYDRQQEKLLSQGGAG
ncbi:MAG: hypothetical protein QF406_02945 [Verrucomicrobiota bacterium]|jgi:uncharacterized DUF497 family protein|nr:hypothetical protein [Verrucomicrobiota bacterium]